MEEKGFEINTYYNIGDFEERDEFRICIYFYKNWPQTSPFYLIYSTTEQR